MRKITSIVLATLIVLTVIIYYISAQESTELPTINMKLYFLNNDGQSLVPEARTTEHTGDIIEQIKLVLIELSRGPFSSLLPTLPRETEVREVFLDEKGCVYIDFSRELMRNHPGGTEAEIATVSSIVGTLTQTFPKDIRKVKILIDGREVDTIAGHVDVSRPITAF